MSVRQITAATPKPTRFMSMSFAKFSAASVTPQSTDTRASFHITRKISPNVISPRDIPRITVTDDWLPQLPPVSISIGIAATRTR